jgi:excisionase family DNA binding protein
MDNELLTVPELAMRLKVEVRFVRRLVAERRIPFTKVGKFVRFHRRDVDTFLAEGRVEPIRVEWHDGRVAA